MTAETPDMPVIRRLAAGDIEAFRAIRREALTEAPAAFASTAQDFARLSDAALRDTITNLAVFAAFRDSEPVGLMGLVRQVPSKMAHRGTVIMVYLRAAERGGQAAKRLLGAVEDEARTLGLHQLELAVTVENTAALAFYRREGFRQIGQIPGGFLHEGRAIDEILMMRPIA